MGEARSKLRCEYPLRLYTRGKVSPCGRTSLRPTPSAGSNAARNACSKKTGVTYMPCEFRRNSLATEGCDQRPNGHWQGRIYLATKDCYQRLLSTLAKNLWNLEIAVHKISRIDFLYVAHFKTGNNSVIAKFFRIS